MLAEVIFRRPVVRGGAGSAHLTAGPRPAVLAALSRSTSGSRLPVIAAAVGEVAGNFQQVRAEILAVDGLQQRRRLSNLPVVGTAASFLDVRSALRTTVDEGRRWLQQNGYGLQSPPC